MEVDSKYLDQAIEVLFTDVQVAGRLNLEVQTLRNWRFLNRGPAYRKLGRSVRYSLHDVNVWVEARKVIPAD